MKFIKLIDDSKSNLYPKSLVNFLQIIKHKLINKGSTAKNLISSQ